MFRRDDDGPRAPFPSWQFAPTDQSDDAYITLHGAARRACCTRIIEYVNWCLRSKKRIFPLYLQCATNFPFFSPLALPLKMYLSTYVDFAASRSRRSSHHHLKKDALSFSPLLLSSLTSSEKATSRNQDGERETYNRDRTQHTASSSDEGQKRNARRRRSGKASKLKCARRRKKDRAKGRFTLGNFSWGNPMGKEYKQGKLL